MSWLIKGIVLKNGGIGLHRKLEPLFLGLILGEIVCGSLGTIIGIVLGIPTYGFWVGASPERVDCGSHIILSKVS